MLAASAATTLAMTWPSTMPAFLVLRFLGGLASAFVLVLASSLVLERLAKAGRGDLAAVHFGGVGTGIVLSAAMTWAIDADGLGWRTMWLGGGLIALAGALVAPALISPAGPSDAPAPAAAAASGRSRGLARMALAYGLFGFGYVITATFIVDIVRGSAHARAAEPMIWLVLGLAAAPSVVGWVATSRRLGVLRAFALASILEAVSVLLSIAWTALPGLFLSAALLGGTFMGLTALGLIAGRELTSGSRRAVALMTSAFGVGQILGPVVAGYGYDLTGSFVLPSLLAAAGLVIGAGLAISIRPAAAH
jgi:predicted MFS family arabinose efflux permease